MLLGSIALFLLLVAILIVGSPLLAMAQQTATTPITTTTTPPLTPQEQEQQNRLQSVIAATNQNLDEAEKEVNGIVYNPRWSDVVWVEPDSLAVLFAYCLPGEFAESGQEILGGFELEVLESYEVALPQNFMAWMMVIGNEDRQDRLPAAVGVVCASDLNDAQTRFLSPQEQQQINNVVQQFTTQVTNIEQVINIINNVTTNGTGTTTPPPPPPPPMGNGTGNGTGGGGGVGPRPIGGGEGGIPENATITSEADTTPPVFTSTPDYSYTASNPVGTLVAHSVRVNDNVDGFAELLNLPGQFNILNNDNIAGAITISCNPPSGSIFPVGDTTVQCTATDASGNTAQASFTVRVNRPPIESPFLAQEQEQPPAAEEEAPVQEEQQPPAAEEEQPPVEEEGATTPPANDEGGGGGGEM
jgi:hypothetical protein